MDASSSHIMNGHTCDSHYEQTMLSQPAAIQQNELPSAFIPHECTKCWVQMEMRPPPLVEETEPKSYMIEMMPQVIHLYVAGMNKTLIISIIIMIIFILNTIMYDRRIHYDCIHNVVHACARARRADFVFGNR